MGAFSILWLTAKLPEASATVLLDPGQRYLDDHRPGGEPLLGTVMGLEIMAELALGLAPGMVLQAMDAVQIRQPYIVRGNGPFQITARVTEVPSASDSQLLRCTLYSHAPDTTVTLHFEAQVRAGHLRR